MITEKEYSARDLEVVVPVHAKDLPLLRWCIEGVFRHVQPRRVYVVGSKSTLESAARSMPPIPSLCLVDEDTVVDGLTSQYSSARRSGWYFQQMLKLGAALTLCGGYYLVVDADTVILRPLRFFEAGRVCFDEADEHHDAYFETFEALLGFRPEPTPSFVCHHMVFDAKLVRAMLDRISPLYPWWRNIARLAEVSTSDGSLFSEYETYGNFVKALFPEAMIRRRLNRAVMKSLPSERVIRILSNRFDLCSFHSYMRHQPSGVHAAFWTAKRLAHELFALSRAASLFPSSWIKNA